MVQFMAAQTESELYTFPLHWVLLSPIEWLHEVQSLVNFTIFSTTPQFFQIKQTEIGHCVPELYANQNFHCSLPPPWQPFFVRIIVPQLYANHIRNVKIG